MFSTLYKEGVEQKMCGVTQYKVNMILTSPLGDLVKAVMEENTIYGWNRVGAVFVVGKYMFSTRCKKQVKLHVSWKLFHITTVSSVYSLDYKDTVYQAYQTAQYLLACLLSMDVHVL